MCRITEESMSTEDFDQQMKLYDDLTKECERIFLTFYTEIANAYIEYCRTKGSYRKYKAFEMTTGSDCVNVVNEVRDNFEQRGIRKDFALLAYNEARSKATLSVISNIKTRLSDVLCEVIDN